MIPEPLRWVRSDGLKMHASLRHRVLSLYRPPRWLPCWFHGLWFLLISLTRIRLIVKYEGDGEAVFQVLAQCRCQPQYRLTEIGCICLTARIQALRHLCACSEVGRIWLDGEVQATLDTALAAANAVQVATRHTGSGVTVAVVDTGIHPHPDLEGRIVGFADLIHGRTDPYDDNGHGTHVAGCVGANGLKSDGAFRGPAPGAKLVGVKVLNKMGSGSVSGLLAGIDWVIGHREEYRIRVMSMSLGGPPHGPCADDPLCLAVNRAWAAGIVVVVAAGNEGPERGTVSTPGISPQVITVGAMDDRGTPERKDDSLASFSSRGPTPEGLVKPDILCPGVAITSLRAPGSFIDKQQPEARVGDWYLTLSGTSMATPILAGVIAVMLEVEPHLTPNQVKARLVAAAQDWGLEPDEQGAGYVDVDRAVFGAHVH